MKTLWLETKPKHYPTSINKENCMPDSPLYQDLSCRLPYGVMCKIEFLHGDTPYKMLGIDECHIHLDTPVYDEGDGYFALYDVVPFLRPMSDMTEDEEVEYECVCERHYNEFDNSYFYTDTPLSVDWLNKHMFDYRGLIDKKWATAAPKDMYKFD